MSADCLPPNVPTTYGEEGLVGKLAGSTSPPPMEKRCSWGSCPEVPRSYFPTTYREEGLVGKLPPNFPTTYTDECLVGKLAIRRSLVTPPLQPGFPTTYREEGLVGKLPPNFPTTYREEGLVGKLRVQLPHHL